MGRQLSHRELQELLGAYALDAVDGDERDAVELHLRDCPGCRAEVAESREVAALLAHGGLAAPDGLWDRIAAKLEEAPPRLRLAPVARPRRPRLAPAAAAFAVAAALVAVLGLRVVDLGRRVDRAEAALRRQGMATAALAAATDPRARFVELRSRAGAPYVRAVLLPDGTGYLVGDDLAPLGGDRTYQLWAVANGETVSAGVLGGTPGVLAFHAPVAVSTLAITVEQAGGVVVSRQQPLVSGSVPVAAS